MQGLILLTRRAFLKLMAVGSTLGVGARYLKRKIRTIARPSTIGASVQVGIATVTGTGTGGTYSDSYAGAYA